VKILIKLGGTLLDDQDSRRRLAGELAREARRNSVVVVHGGANR